MFIVIYCDSLVKNKALTFLVSYISQTANNYRKLAGDIIIEIFQTNINFYFIISNFVNRMLLFQICLISMYADDFRLHRLICR